MQLDEQPLSKVRELLSNPEPLAERNIEMLSASSLTRHNKAPYYCRPALGSPCPQHNRLVGASA